MQLLSPSLQIFVIFAIDKILIIYALLLSFKFNTFGLSEYKASRFILRIPFFTAGNLLLPAHHPYFFKTFINTKSVMLWNYPMQNLIK